jgi:hypothetical protein
VVPAAVLLVSVIEKSLNVIDNHRAVRGQGRL